MKEKQNITLEVVKACEISSGTKECIRVILLKRSRVFFVLMMEGFSSEADESMTQLGTAKTFKDETQAHVQYDCLVKSLSMVWKI